MRTSSHAPFYDLFKLIVTAILLIVFLILLLTRSEGSSQLNASIATSSPPPPTLTAVPPTQTLVQLTDTPIPTSSATQTEIPTQTITPPPTEAVTDEPLPTPIVEVPSDPEACAAYSRSQLQVGMRAAIQRPLNFRSYPGLFRNLILTNGPGVEVEVVGGPACTRYEQGGAYLWWEIKLPNGLTGWSAEASAFGAFYFMEPSQ